MIKQDSLWYYISRGYILQFNIKQCTTTEHIILYNAKLSWWRQQVETFSALLDLCAGNSPVTGEFPAQKPVTRNFDVFFDLHLNKRLSK